MYKRFLLKCDIYNHYKGWWENTEFYFDTKEEMIDFIKNGDLLYLANKNSVVYRNNIEIRAVADRLNDLLQILEDKEVSK